MPRKTAAVRSIEETIATDRPHRRLTQTQEEIADPASQMILYGGAEEDVEMFLTAIARHRLRHVQFSTRCGDKLDNSTRALAVEWAARWLRDLGSRWRKNEPSTITGNSELARNVTEMVRADIRRFAQKQFEEFLSRADGIEPLWALRDILNEVQQR